MSEVTVKLGADNSEFRSSMDEAAAYSGKTFEQVEHHLLGARAVATAVGTALGLHLEKIAENVARFVTGMTEEVEEGLKEMVKASDEALRANAESAKESASVQDRITNALRMQSDALEKHDKLKAEIEERSKRLNALADDETLSMFQANRLRDQAKQTDEESFKLQHLANVAAQAGLEIAKLRNTEEKQAAELQQEQDRVLADIAKEREKIAMDGAKVTAGVLDNLEKQRKEMQDLIADEVKRKLAAQGTLNEFEKQLDVIQKMQGSDRTGFKVGQDNTVSVGDLAKAVDAAKSALDFAKSANQLNDPNGGARQVIEAQAVYDQAVKNYDIGRFASITSNNATRISTSLLDFTPVGTTANAALGTRESAATAQALATIGKHSAATSKLLQQIKAGLIPGGVSTGEDTATITGPGGAPDSTPLSGVTGSIGGLF